MLFDYQKQQELEEARKKESRQKARETPKKYSTGKNKGEAKRIIGDAKNLAKNMTLGGLFSLLFQISLSSDWMYFLAFLAAFVKDCVDLLSLGPLFFVGTITGFLASIFIGLMMFLGSVINQTGSKYSKIIRGYMILAGATIVEAFMPGLNFLPIETFSALFIWALLLSDRKQAGKNQGYSKKMAEAH